MGKLFDWIFGKMIDRRIAAYQNDIIEKHCDEVENMYKQMRGWRHDFANHMQNIGTLLDKNEYGLWIKHYSISEMWDKNVIGGRPV